MAGTGNETGAVDQPAPRERSERAQWWRPRAVRERPLAPSRTGKVAGFGGGALVVTGLVALAFATAGSSNGEQMPALTLSVTKAAGDNVNIQVNAAAPGVRSDGKLMLRVVALNVPDGTNPSRACQSVQPVGLEGAKKFEPIVFRVLHWGESGANAAGEATVAARVGASAKEFNHVCAYTTVSGEGYDQAGSAWAIANLAVPFTEAAPSPAPKP